MNTGSYDVHDFGAMGDGKTKDMEAIQSAIDCCEAAGGGVILLAGAYLLQEPCF